MTLFAENYFSLVKVGNSGSTLSDKISWGVFQKNMAPSLPTEIIVCWSGEILILFIDPEWPSPS